MFSVGGAGGPSGIVVPHSRQWLALAFSGAAHSVQYSCIDYSSTEKYPDVQPEKRKASFPSHARLKSTI
jgi:hypothetical protein